MTKIENAKHQFFSSKEEYLQFKALWKQLHKDPTVHLTRFHFFIYAAVRGKDLKTQFSPISARKIPSKGPEPYYAYNTTLSAFSVLTCNGSTERATEFRLNRLNEIIRVFDGLITFDHIKLIADSLSAIRS